MRSYLLLAALLFALSISTNAKAYFNVTYINTTVVLGSNTTAHVIENILVYVSNSSVSQYQQDRGALTFTLSDWQKAIGSPTIVQHIVNPTSSITNFTFLPGPLVDINAQGGQAELTMIYYVNNVTNFTNIAPRIFQYNFNDYVFNFQHASSGQILSPDTKLNIRIPYGAQLVSVYPAPDSPPPDTVGSYPNDTTFSWYASEPLSKFRFSYTVQESLQEEVIGYFTYVYKTYTALLYLLLIALIALAAFYALAKARG